LHGANRLASSSLLEGLLWAKLAADNIVEYPEKIDQNRKDKIPDWKLPKDVEEFDPLLISSTLVITAIFRSASFR